MRKTLASIFTAGALVAAAIPASAAPSETASRHAHGANIVEIVLAVSGDSGFDRNGRDFDLLRDALVATDLAGAVAEADGVTVFAPNDRAFKILARELGWEGRGERSAFGFLVSELGAGTISDVLLYHVGTRELGLRDLFRHSTVDTLLGPELRTRWFRIIDADTDDRNARVTFPWFVPAENGVIVVIDRVLRPVNLP